MTDQPALAEVGPSRFFIRTEVLESVSDPRARRCLLKENCAPGALQPIAVTQCIRPEALCTFAEFSAQRQLGGAFRPRGVLIYFVARDLRRLLAEQSCEVVHDHVAGAAGHQVDAHLERSALAAQRAGSATRFVERALRTVASAQLSSRVR